MEKFHHNIWIAHALNFMTVPKVSVVVKAETGKDNVADNFCKYSYNFMEIPLGAVAVLVLHMDTVDPSDQNKYTEAIKEELGFI